VFMPIHFFRMAFFHLFGLFIASYISLLVFWSSSAVS